MGQNQVYMMYTIKLYEKRNRKGHQTPNQHPPSFSPSIQNSLNLEEKNNMMLPMQTHHETPY